MSIPSLLAKSIVQVTLFFFWRPTLPKRLVYKLAFTVTKLKWYYWKQGLDEDTVQQQSYTLLSTNVESTWEYMSS